MEKVLITGGNKGIGLETTKLLLEKGYKVIVVARDFSKFELAHKNLKTVEFDVSQTSKIPQLVESLGDIDILINNAGVMYSLPYDEYPEENVEMMLKINIKAPVKFIECCSKSMLKKGRGRVVNNASISSHIGHPDVWYGITKAGLANATKTFSKTFGGKIVVNSVAPSPVETDMLDTIPLARREAFLKTVASNRFAKAREVAQTLVWLATESPDYINGSCIDINDSSYTR